MFGPPKVNGGADMSMLGADLAALRDFAGHADRRSQEIAALMGRLDGVVQGLPWLGADRDHFLDEWSGHRQSLNDLVHDLAQAASTAVRHADDQERASHAGGGGGGEGW
jgi:uncharacterized protein YukE